MPEIASAEYLPSVGLGVVRRYVVNANTHPVRQPFRRRFKTTNLPSTTQPERRIAPNWSGVLLWSHYELAPKPALLCGGGIFLY